MAFTNAIMAFSKATMAFGSAIVACVKARMALEKDPEWRLDRPFPSSPFPEWQKPYAFRLLSFRILASEGFQFSSKGWTSQCRAFQKPRKRQCPALRKCGLRSVQPFQGLENAISRLLKCWTSQFPTF